MSNWVDVNNIQVEKFTGINHGHLIQAGSLNSGFTAPVSFPSVFGETIQYGPWNHLVFSGDCEVLSLASSEDCILQGAV